MMLSTTSLKKQITSSSSVRVLLFVSFLGVLIFLAIRPSAPPTPAAPDPALAQQVTPSPAPLHQHLGCQEEHRETAGPHSSGTATQPEAPAPALPINISFPAILAKQAQRNSNSLRIPVPGADPLLAILDSEIPDGEYPDLISGRIVAPKPGYFFFSRQETPGVAGDLVGVIHFDDGSPGYRVEPLGPDGTPVLVERSVDELLCHQGESYGIPEQTEPSNDEINLPKNHPANPPIPAYQEGIVPLSSLPGSIACVYLDFNGEKGPHAVWRNGDFDAQHSGLNNAQIYDIWIRVSEDFSVFNINVTTDLAEFQAAPKRSRQRCIITPSREIIGGAAGVAYIGSFNWTNDSPCWCLPYTDTNGAAVISHELGHTLKLYHDGRGGSPYYGGHGIGATSWGPIMGTAYSRSLGQWSKGQYNGATRTEDDIYKIGNNNNSTAQRDDRHGNSISTASPLKVDPITGEVNEKEIIESSGDLDVFSFITAGGPVNLVVQSVIFGGNIDLEAVLIDDTGAVLLTSNPAQTVEATINTVLTAGEYFLQINGVGNGDPYTDPPTGYTDYGSIGAFKISGTIAAPVAAQIINAPENSAPGSVLGVVQTKNLHGANPLTFTLTGGDLYSYFTLGASDGILTVAPGAVVNYEQVATNWTEDAELSLAVTVVDTVDPGLNENLVVRVPIVDLNDTPTFTSLPTVTIYETTELGTPFATAKATDEDFFQLVNYTITGGDPSGNFAIDPETGALSLASPPATAGVTFDLTIQAEDTGTPAASSTGIAQVTIGSTPPGFVAETKTLNPLSYLADSIEDWEAAPSPTDPWRYGADDGTGFTPTDALTSIAGVNIGGSGQAHTVGGALPAIGQFAMAPADTVAAVRRWTSTHNGTIKIAYDARQIEAGGDGQGLTIAHNGISIFSQTLTAAIPHTAGHLIVTVAPGDTLAFAVDSGASSDATADWTHFHARITDRYRSTEDSTLLFRYAMDESYLYPATRAGVVVDSSGNNRHATVESAAPVLAWVAGEIDNAAHFDGINDGLITDAADIGDTSTALTLSLWIRPDSKSPLDAIFGSSGTTRFGLDLSDTGFGNPIRFTVGTSTIVGPDHSGRIGRWTHVVGVWEANQTFKLYLDGVEVASDSSPLLAAEVDRWIIGRDAPLPPTTPHHFDGRIDDVALWSRALPSGEVLALFENGTDVHEFDGTAADVRILPHSPIANGATEMTLAAWIKPSSVNDNDAILSSTGPSFCALLLSGSGSGNPLEFRALGNRLTAEDNTGPIGQWTHAVGVWKQGQFQRFYLDGVEVGTSPSPSPPGGTFEIDQWKFGQDRNNSSRIFHGLVGNLLIMEHALDPADVVALHSVGQFNTGASSAAFDTAEDIGTPAAPGTFEEISGRYLLNATGTGFSGTADSGHFLSRPHTGDGAIGAFLDSIEDTGSDAAAGVMIRESSAVDAPFAFLFRRPDHSVALRWRSSAGASVQESPPVPNIGNPGWVRLVRRGNNLIALYSEDQLAWTKLDTVTLTMTAAARFGLAATSGIDDTISSSYFHAAAMSDLGPDADLDGLPDSWEDLHYGGLDGTDGETDTDGDGFTDRDEYVTGTDPNDRSAFFTTTIGLGANDEAGVLTWTSLAGRIYTVETSTTLEEGSWTVFEDQIPASPPSNTFDIPVLDDKRFYRIGAELGGD